MSDRESMLLARLATEENRSKAAEARCKRLEGAIRNHLKLCTEDTWQAMEAALSDTAQQETRPMTLCDSGGGSALFQKIAEDHQANMRERAAKLAAESFGFTDNHPVILAIRALPIDPETGGE